MVFGKLLAIDSEITDVDFTYVEDFVDIVENKNLIEAKIMCCNNTISLGKNLSLKRVILGTVDRVVNLKDNVSLELAHVDSAVRIKFNGCTALKKAYIKTTTSDVTFYNCRVLEVLTIGHIGRDLNLVGCTKLRLENLSADNDSNKIYVESHLYLDYNFAKPVSSNLLEGFKYTLYKTAYTTNQVLKRFDVKKENIITKDRN